MKICIVNPGGRNWILHKISEKLVTELLKQGVEAISDDKPDFTADINHYFYLVPQALTDLRPCDTLFITHVDDAPALFILREELKTAHGICMSRDHLEELVAAGCPREKLCSIRIGIDHWVHKRKIQIGIPSRCYRDGRKRQDLLIRLAGILDPDVFSFHILGSGWETTVNLLRSHGFQVDYEPDFTLEKHIAFFEKLDYTLYMGYDEGAIGVLDSIDAGVPAIVTRQGYHLDVSSGIHAFFDSWQELRKIFLRLQQEKKQIIATVENWTWRHYAEAHLQIWQRLLSGESIVGSYDGQIARKRSRWHLFRRQLKNTLLRSRRQPILALRRLAALTRYYINIIQR